MSPKEFLYVYRNLQVRLVSGRHLRIDMHQYRNAKGLWDDEPVTGDKKCVEGFYKAKPALEAAIRKVSMKLGGSGYRMLKGKNEYVNIGRGGDPGILNPFDGNLVNYDMGELVHVFDAKGSPDQVSRALALAADLGVVNKLLNRPEGPATQSDVQAFCDKYIGIDCNGFVGNYCKAIGMTSPGPSTPVGSFAAKGMRRKSLEEVRPLDALVWMKSATRGSHVAIIDSILSERREEGKLVALDCLVCESAGSSRDTSTKELAENTDGLADTIYTITWVGGDIKPFNVKRGLGWHYNPRAYNAKSSGKVAIASLS